jgi:hypothetical protein
MCSRTSLSQTRKMAGIAIGAAALLAMTAPALSAEAPSKDEVLTLTTAIQVPGIPGLVSYDISYADPVLKKYFLADRNSKAIDIVETGGQFRADEGCFDPVDQLVVAANPNEVPWPWISFIATSGPNAYTVVKKLVFDGFNGVTGEDRLDRAAIFVDDGRIAAVRAAAEEDLILGADRHAHRPGAGAERDRQDLLYAHGFRIEHDHCAGRHDQQQHHTIRVQKFLRCVWLC